MEDENRYNPEKERIVPAARFDARKTRVLLDLIQDRGLVGLFHDADPKIRKVLKAQRQKTGKTYGSETDLVLDEMEQFSRSIGSDDYDDTFSFSSNLTFRYVSENGSGSSVDQIIEDSEINGGKSKKDDTPGINVDDGSKIVDYLTIQIEQNKDNVVVFIYNKSKLQGLSKEESEQTNFVGGYGVKPKDGLTLRDALLGTMVLEGRE